MADKPPAHSVADALRRGTGVQQGQWCNIACDQPGTRSLALALGVTQVELDLLLPDHALKKVTHTNYYRLQGVAAVRMFKSDQSTGSNYTSGSMVLVTAKQWWAFGTEPPHTAQYYINLEGGGVHDGGG